MTKLPARWALRLGLAVALVLAASGVLIMASSGPGVRRAVESSTREVAKKPATWRDLLALPIRSPAVVAAQDAGLQPDEMVIGVIAGGRARAYRLGTMARLSQHLINDLVGGVPVSVSYCDRNECVRVYTGPSGSQPMELKVAGLLDGEMVLDAGGNLYFQDSGKAVEPDVLESSHDPVAVAHARRERESSRSGRRAGEIPYTTLAPLLTTWQEWIDRHPQSDVHTGARPAAEGGSGKTPDR
jgi:Protein of unknown function (DUF3179)